MRKKQIIDFNMQFFANEPPANPPGGDPPVNPPVNNPPANPPPANPPAGDPPANNPPANNPPGTNPPAAGAPEKYADFTLPQGMKVNQDFMTRASAKFKEVNLTQEQAQGFVNLYAEHMQSLNQNFEDLKNGWKEQLVKDLGPKHQEEMAFAAKCRDQFLSPETVKFLDESGLSDHPLLVKDFIKIGKAMAEDKFVPGGKGGQEPDKMQTFFPNSQIPR